MPRATPIVQAGDVRIPRTLFAHSHKDALNWFPSTVSSDPIIYQLLPDNWNGVDKLVVWFLLEENWTNAPFTFTLDAGTCGEAPNTHTGQIVNKLLTGANGTYICVDLTTDLAIVIALLNSTDMLKMSVDDVNEVGGRCIGMEIQET